MLQNTPLDGTARINDAIIAYLREVQQSRDVCMRHEKTAAIHERSQELEVYRMFDRKRETADQLIQSAKILKSWEESIYWPLYGALWEKLKGEVADRVEKHAEQFHIVCKGIEWEGIPILIHAYKFDADPKMKVELIVPHFEGPPPTLPLPMRLIAQALRCHEFLIPEHIAKPCPPYAGHEAQFQTIEAYVSLHTPPSLYAAKRLPTSQDAEKT